MPNPDAHRKLADCVEALREVEGVTVEDYHIDEEPIMEDVNPIKALLGGASEDEITFQDILHIKLSLDGEKQEMDGGDDDGVSIEIDEEDEVTESNLGEGKGHETVRQ